MVDSAPFEAYRNNPPSRVGVGRLIVGVLIIAFCWLLGAVATVTPLMMMSGGDMEVVFNTPQGALAMLASFGGIWLGVWLAMRWLHKERVSKLFGANGRTSWGDFRKAFAAVVITSLLSEVLIYLIEPHFVRSEVSYGTWAMYLIPVALLCFVQTSSEEILFRGYLMRGLANRFRSPWIWAVLPGLAFVAMHYTPAMDGLDILLLMLTIGVLTIALVVTVYITGNLGAAFGIHMGNNLFAFLLVSHQAELSSFTLFHGASVDAIGDSLTQVFVLGAISIVCVGAMMALLLHRASPLRIDGRT